MHEITIREGTLADIPTIAHHRRRMCEDMNYSDADALSTMVTATSEYLKKAVPEGSFRSWLACTRLRSRMPPRNHPECLYRP